MTASEECRNLIKYGILVRESMRRLTQDYGDVEEPFIESVDTIVEKGDPQTALDAISFESQLAVKFDSEKMKAHVQKLSSEFEANHSKCGVCGALKRKEDMEEHLATHEE